MSKMKIASLIDQPFFTNIKYIAIRLLIDNLIILGGVVGSVRGTSAAVAGEVAVVGGEVVGEVVDGVMPGGSEKIAANDITFSDKFSKTVYRNQIAERGWTNQLIADAINNPVKIGNSINKFTGNSVTVYYVDNVHYVAVDNVTGKVIQVADMAKPSWVFDLTK